MRCPRQRRDRRAFLGLLGVGLAVTATGCAGVRDPEPGGVGSGARPTGPVALDRRLEALRRIAPGQGDVPPSEPGDHLPAGAPEAAPKPPPGKPIVLNRGPAGSVAAHQVAITVDDGSCEHCVAGYVAFAQRTGVHLTFSPNGMYGRSWEPQASVLRPLVDGGQVQLINHTFHHPNLTALPAGRIREELERNEAWIHHTFGTSSLPYYRPPFGRHGPAVDEVAAGVGFDRVVMWNGSYSDSTLITPEFLMAQAARYLWPGTIVLGHANHPTVLGLFDQILDLIKQRALTPVTLDEMFGTRRPSRAG